MKLVGAILRNVGYTQLCCSMQYDPGQYGVIRVLTELLWLPNRSTKLFGSIHIYVCQYFSYVGQYVGLDECSSYTTAQSS